MNLISWSIEAVLNDSHYFRQRTSQWRTSFGWWWAVACNKTTQKIKIWARLFNRQQLCINLEPICKSLTRTESWDVGCWRFYLYRSRRTSFLPLTGGLVPLKLWRRNQKLTFKIARWLHSTGASPNGATPSDQVQTFTSPSGKGSMDAEAGKQLLDDTFKDTRIAVYQLSAPIDRKLGLWAWAGLPFEVNTLSIIRPKWQLVTYISIRRTPH